MPIRQILKSHVSITGRHGSPKSVGHADFECLLEADHLIVLEFAREVRAYEAQPAQVVVPARSRLQADDFS